ncbi:MAG: DUF4116 domain-containing protein [Treponema sp.]|nr:DUF4116 domain-containing protein [Treponema sp.]
MPEIKFATMEEALEAIRQDGCALEHVPKNLKTLRLCLEAVSKESLALEYVPENLRTLSICSIAAKGTKSN